MAEIVLDRVVKRFGAATVLEETSFTVRDGEFFVLVGPSGCGKSTLLNMIVGLEDVSGGEIRLDGRVINDLDPKDRNMAMVFQSYAIYPHMTVRENIAFPLRIAKRPPQEIAERVERAAAMLELTALLDRRPRALSGGQRQRVAMGRAMVREPAVYLLDEPLSNLDARLRVQMRGELARLQQRLATTTLYVTHDQTEAMTLGDRVAVLRRGRVQQIGTPRELYAVPENLFVAGFIGSPAMNFLPARREGARLTVADTALTVPAASSPALPARPVVAIRPEAMRLQRRSGDDLSLRVRAEVVEWLGAEIYVYSTLAGDSNWLRGILPDDVGVEARRGDGVPLVVRLDAAAGVREGEMLELFVAPSALQLFDPASGRRLGTLASA